MKKNHSLIAIALVVVLVACGSNSSDTTGGSDTTTASESTMNSFNDADVMFAQMMIPHHEQAIEMSDIALDPTVGASQQILDLATQIKAAQDPEITQMKNLLTAWNMPIAGERNGSLIDDERNDVFGRDGRTRQEDGQGLRCCVGGSDDRSP